MGFENIFSIWYNGYKVEVKRYKKMKKMNRFILWVCAIVLIVSSLVLGYTEAYAATKKTPAKPKIAVKVSDNEVTVTINKTKNATGYEIYIKNSDASSYEKIATIKKNGKAKRTYKLSDLQKGTYKIKVRAYNGNKFSKYSAVKTVEIKEDKYESVAYHFRNNNLLEQHFEKHGKEMGFETKEAYEKAASDVINNPKALFKTEAEDGDYVYYVEETNEFVVLSLDGFIRTYFLPSSGKKYFDRQ